MARALLLAAAVALVGCASAYALRAEVGDTVVSATIEVTPRKLPEKRRVPIELTSVTRVWMKDGSTPPSLAKLRFRLDRYGAINSRGVPVCTMKRLAGTTPALARKRCAGALVGSGVAKARIDLPGEPPVKVSSPLSFFNGPRQGGEPSLIAHAYERIPEPKAVLVPIPVERIRKGRYGFQVEVKIPEIAGGDGVATLAKATLGRTFKRHGRRVGYLSARCVGSRLQVDGFASFRNGDFFPATLVSSCRATD